ncbi:hypothetical protein M8C21_028761, partial [Ambrosia artemisiifolia]
EPPNQYYVRIKCVPQTTKSMIINQTKQDMNIMMKTLRFAKKIVLMKAMPLDVLVDKIYET